MLTRTNNYMEQTKDIEVKCNESNQVNSEFAIDFLRTKTVWSQLMFDTEHVRGENCIPVMYK